MNNETGGTIKRKTVKEHNVRISSNATMNVSEQCSISASKGNRLWE